jgi:ATPase family AAA domain-containing protein 3A/B
MNNKLIMVLLITHAGSAAGFVSSEQAGVNAYLDPLREMQTQGARNYERKSDRFKKEIARLEDDIAAVRGQQAKLDEQLRKGSIRPEVYDRSTATITKSLQFFESRLEAKQQEYDRFNTSATKAGDMLEDIVGQGAKTMFKMIENDATQKTQVLTAAASAAAGQDVANAGRLQQMQFLFSGDVLQRTAIALVGTSAGVAGAYYGVQLVYNQANKFLNNPPVLVRETSSTSLIDDMKKWWSKKAESSFFDGIVFSPTLEVALNDVVVGVQNAHKNKLPARNLLLYGPPGTGKTMVAKRLARTCGLDYAIVAGSDFAQFSPGDAVIEMRRLFDWGRRSARGMVIVIDEAEGLFAPRKAAHNGQHNTKQTEATLAAFLAFLAETGEKAGARKKGVADSPVMVVALTNHPILDEAIYSRFPQKIEIGLPGEIERARILQVYLNQYFGAGNAQEATIAADVTEATLQQLAKRLDGFAGRDLEDIVSAVQYYLANHDQTEVTHAVLTAVIEQKLSQRADLARFITQ